MLLKNVAFGRIAVYGNHEVFDPKVANVILVLMKSQAAAKNNWEKSVV